ncbi:MAG TPA: lipoyl synthase [Bacillota bacterium]
MTDHEHQRKPDWLKIRLAQSPRFRELKRLMRDLDLHTVCEEARCPNIHECWSHGTATFMILGRICTRACAFCAVHTGLPTELDLAEPERVADAVAHLGLRHVVITSVARDDLADGGASIFADTIRAVRARTPAVGIEVLIPDFQGKIEALRTVVDAAPDILNHNVETVRRLSPVVRARARHDRSLELLRRAKDLARQRGLSMLTKSGLMVGLGESREEVIETLRELRAVDCDIVTIGQYLRPSQDHLPVVRYWTPSEFAELKQIGLELGFKHVESGPLVRSSYHAHEQVEHAQNSEATAGVARG